MAPVSIGLTRLSEDELLDLNRRINERLRLMGSARQFVELARFTVGMHVEFTTDDSRILQGEITRLNRKTATICCSPGPLAGQSVAASIGKGLSDRCLAEKPLRSV